MDAAAPTDRLGHLLEEVVARPGERVAIEVESGEPDAQKLRFELEGRLAGLRKSGAAIDVPNGLESRLFGPFSGSERTLDSWLRSRSALLAAWDRVNPVSGEAVGAAVSHTSSGALAIVRVRPEGPPGAWVGIDLEAETRTISAGVRRRIHHPQDEAAGAPAIGLWTLKEAVFKAVGDGAFRDIEMRLEAISDRVWRGRARWRGRQFDLALVRAEGYIAAVALADPR